MLVFFFWLRACHEINSNNRLSALGTKLARNGRESSDAFFVDLAKSELLLRDGGGSGSREVER